MEKKWDTVIPADVKRLFVSETYVPLVMKGLKTYYNPSLCRIIVGLLGYCDMVAYLVRYATISQ